MSRTRSSLGSALNDFLFSSSKSPKTSKILEELEQITETISRQNEHSVSAINSWIVGSVSGGKKSQKKVPHKSKPARGKKKSC